MAQKDLEKMLGIIFKDKKLLKTAFTHRSYLNETDEDVISNERLEFLGDAVLEFVVSNYLYNKYPDFPEGKLTSLRSILVCTNTLANVAIKSKLGDYLLLSKGEEEGGGRQNETLLANVVEALIGAIYLDSGIKIANLSWQDVMR